MAGSPGNDLPAASYWVGQTPLADWRHKLHGFLI